MTLTVLTLDGVLTVQDLGRPGMARYGLGSSGAADRRSAQRANGLLGNETAAAVLELAGTSLVLQAAASALVAVAGAHREVTVDTHYPYHFAPDSFALPLFLSRGDLLHIGPATRGVFSYLAIRGGVEVTPVLGARSYDVLAGVGPPPLWPGDVISVGSMFAQTSELVGPVPLPDEHCLLRVIPGPRAEYLSDPAALYRNTFDVIGHSRTALRLHTEQPLARRAAELPSEGLLPGAIQVPGDGQPLIFLADHPVTGGYPVVGCLRAEDVDRAAQCRPGTTIQFVPSSG